MMLDGHVAKSVAERLGISGTGLLYDRRTVKTTDTDGTGPRTPTQEIYIREAASSAAMPGQRPATVTTAR